jgi:hypothetical protein
MFLSLGHSYFGHYFGLPWRDCWYMTVVIIKLLEYIG